jgi:hypothetical protein
MSDEENGTTSEEIPERRKKPKAKAKVKKAAAKKKAAPKVKAKARPAKKESTPKGPKKVDTTPVKEVFSTQPPAQDEVEVPANSVMLLVNGSRKGLIDTTGMKLGQFVMAQAQRHSIRSFSVYVEGAKIDDSLTQTNRLMAGIAKIEIVAKDARADRRRKGARA